VATGTTTGGASKAQAPGGMTDLQAQVETTRSWTGLWAVAIGDVVIAVAAILGVYWVKGGGTSSTSVVSIITSGFTAIGTLTTAYFGIKAVANTANTTTLNPGSATAGPPSTQSTSSSTGTGGTTGSTAPSGTTAMTTPTATGAAPPDTTAADPSAASSPPTDPPATDPPTTPS
jgi:hypothetical protein